MRLYVVETSPYTYEPPSFLAVTDSLARALELSIKDAEDTHPDRFYTLIHVRDLNEPAHDLDHSEHYILTKDEASDMLKALSTET